MVQGLWRHRWSVDAVRERVLYVSAAVRPTCFATPYTSAVPAPFLSSCRPSMHTESAHGTSTRLYGIHYCQNRHTVRAPPSSAARALTGCAALPRTSAVCLLAAPALPCCSWPAAGDTSTANTSLKGAPTCMRVRECEERERERECVCVCVCVCWGVASMAASPCMKGTDCKGREGKAGLGPGRVHQPFLLCALHAANQHGRYPVPHARRCSRGHVARKTPMDNFR